LATIERIVHELDNLFVFFNWRFFSGELQKPVIAVQTNQHHGGAMGWCVTRKMWRQTQTQEEYYEITVCPEFFDLGLVKLCDTLLHELVHLFNLQKGISDTSRGGYYHNEKFKQQALKRGLLVEKHPKYGWSLTNLKPETIKFVESLKIDREVFNLMRKRPFSSEEIVAGETGGASNTNNAQDASPLPRQSYRKYICPACSISVKATKDVRVKCDDCGVLMEKVAKDRG
jgi:DNA-directed RNA polymerase subunit RPC12/RpoP